LVVERIWEQPRLCLPRPEILSKLACRDVTDDDGSTLELLMLARPLLTV
jgi:hypothetical protein